MSKQLYSFKNVRPQRQRGVDGFAADFIGPDEPANGTFWHGGDRHECIAYWKALIRKKTTGIKKFKINQDS